MSIVVVVVVGWWCLVTANCVPNIESYRPERKRYNFNNTIEPSVFACSNGLHNNNGTTTTTAKLQASWRSWNICGNKPAMLLETDGLFCVHEPNPSSPMLFGPCGEKHWSTIVFAGSKLSGLILLLLQQLPEWELVSGHGVWPSFPFQDPRDCPGMKGMDGTNKVSFPNFLECLQPDNPFPPLPNYND